MFDQMIKEVGNRFSLGNKALPLVQTLVQAMTNPETHGLTGFIDKFRQHNLGYLIESWTNSKAPLTINHAQINGILGGDNGILDSIMQKVGLDKGSSLLSLAYLLPQLMQKLAPNGQIDPVFIAAATQFAGQSISPAAAPQSSLAPSPSPSPAKQADWQEYSLDWIVNQVAARFNLGGKALPLVQTVIASMTDSKTGGLSGFIQGFKQHGLQGLTDSWTLSNAPLSINQREIENVVGGKGNLLDTLVTKLNLDKGTALSSLAFLIPALCHKLIPHGQAPNTLPDDVNAFAAKGMALIASPGSAAADASTTSLESSGTQASSVSDSNTLNPVSAAAGATLAAAGVSSLITERAASKNTPVDYQADEVNIGAASTTSSPISQTSSAKISEADPAAFTASSPNMSYQAQTERPSSNVDSTAENESGPWKYLLWLLPVAIALWLLKSCGDASDSSNSVSSTATTENQTAAPAIAPNNSEINSNANNLNAESTTANTSNTDRATSTAAVASSNEVNTPSVNTESTPDKTASIDTATQTTATTSEASTASVTADTSTSTEVSNTTPSADALAIPSTKLYFALAKTKLPTDTAEKLKPIISYLKTNKAAKVSISGFHDPSGNPVANENLAKNRAQQVYAKLKAAGIADETIVMNKPSSTTGTGDNAEARRVEVSVMP